MSAHRFYGYGPCGTCRRALVWLRQQRITVDSHDITLTPPDRAVLAEALGRLGRSRLLNTSGQSYRALGAERVRAMGDEQLIDALVADGRLIRRPFLITADGAVLTGFREPEWAASLLA